jgi:hypothetical protein
LRIWLQTSKLDTYKCLLECGHVLVALSSCSVYNDSVSNNNTPLASAGQTGNVNITDITEEEILDALKALDSKSTIAIP